MIGLTRLEIPITEDEVNEETIAKYFTKVYDVFKDNLNHMEMLHEYYLGKQKILDKSRYVGNNGKSNEQIVENHALNIVDFKSGYNFAEPIQYSISNEATSSDDISELNKYMRAIHKESKDMENAEDMYCCGLTTRLVMPRSSETEESPFEIYNLSYNSGFVVYSSGYRHEKLFGVVISKRATDEVVPSDLEPYTFMCYAKNGVYKVDLTLAETSIVQKVSDNPTGMVNMVECKTNKYYVSPIDVVMTILDAINQVTSDSVDNVTDFVNSILVIINQELDKETLQMVREEAALSLKSTPNMPADAKFLVNALNHTDVNVIYDNLVKTAYDIVGVPRTSTTITSGGDTGQARLLGGGWTKAEQVAKKEWKYIEDSERELLDIILKICKSTPSVDISLNCGDIKVGSNRTLQDNILSKCQAAMNLYQIGVPEETILEFIGLSTNNHEIALAWKENVRQKQLEQQQSLQTYTSMHFEDDVE